MTMRITDLEKFSLEQVWRPYWPTWLKMHGEEWDQHTRLTKPHMPLDETANELRKRSPWSDMVVGRLVGCRVEFPYWVMHDLVDVVRERIDEAVGFDRSKGGAPYGIGMYVDESKRLRELLVDGGALMDQMLLDIGSVRPLTSPTDVYAWRVKAGLE